MARRFIIEVIPNKAPQKAYTLQPVEFKEKKKHFIDHHGIGNNVSPEMGTTRYNLIFIFNTHIVNDYKEKKYLFLQRSSLCKES